MTSVCLDLTEKRGCYICDKLCQCREEVNITVKIWVFFISVQRSLSVHAFKFTYYPTKSLLFRDTFQDCRGTTGPKINFLKEKSKRKKEMRAHQQTDPETMRYRDNLSDSQSKLSRETVKEDSDNKNYS